MREKITWLQFSDMHVFAQEAGNVAVMQAYQELAETIKPDFIVVTGDFRHLGRGTDFANGIVQLEKLLSLFGVEKQNVFLIPGNHDVGPVADSDERTIWIKDIHENIGKDYQYYEKYKDKLLESFSEYRNMVSQFYNDVMDDCNPRIAKCDNAYHICWNNMLNIVCMNTALVSYKCRNKKDDWDKAEKYYLKALRLQESILDGDHAAIPITYNNLATLYMERNLDGDWDRAEELYIKAITIGEKKLGNGHPDVAIAYCNLASLYRERNSPGDWDNAEVLVVGAVHILETALGKDHPDTASAYINLASLYMDNNLKKNLNKAERFLLMAKTVFERVYGVKHPNTIKVYQRLMILYGDRKQLGDRERSLEYFYKSNTKKQLRELSFLK